MMIPSIPTTYQGVKYRSRTEARFAAFLDYFKIRHEYEPRKYNLDGIIYIPDFWLPDADMWVEMKGQPPTPHEMEKARRLFQKENNPVLIISGVPFAIEREMPPHLDEDGYVLEEGYDPTGEPAYSCMLFATMVDTTKSGEVRSYPAELTDIAFVYCCECQNLCIGERKFDDDLKRDFYIPICGCRAPFKHAAEIELLDFILKSSL